MPTKQSLGLFLWLTTFEVGSYCWLLLPQFIEGSIICCPRLCPCYFPKRRHQTPSELICEVLLKVIAIPSHYQQGSEYLLCFLEALISIRDKSTNLHRYLQYRPLKVSQKPCPGVFIF